MEIVNEMNDGKMMERLKVSDEKRTKLERSELLRVDSQSEMKRKSREYTNNFN